MSLDDDVASILASAPQPDEASRRACSQRAADVLRPRGALARLDEICAWLAAWQRTERPSVQRAAAIVFVADHGVTDERVSAYPREVTSAMLHALQSGAATACAMAKMIGCDLRVVDVGVGRPTGNIALQPALTDQQVRAGFESGRAAVFDLECDLLAVGEMGIGNTTAASAVSAALFGGRTEHWTGRGAGVDFDGWKRKVDAVERARSRAGDGLRPLEILRQLGGHEFAAMAGATVEARRRSIPMLLDGFVATAAVAPLHKLHPGALDHCIAAHRSPEPGHSLLLDELGKKPLMDLQMRLGEATGALAAIPLVQLAIAAVVDVATFSERGLSR